MKKISIRLELTEKANHAVQKVQAETLILEGKTISKDLVINKILENHGKK